MDQGTFMAKVELELRFLGIRKTWIIERKMEEREKMEEIKAGRQNITY